jgi:hypothetical protein
LTVPCPAWPIRFERLGVGSIAASTRASGADARAFGLGGSSCGDEEAAPDDRERVRVAAVRERRGQALTGPQTV